MKNIITILFAFGSIMFCFSCKNVSKKQSNSKPENIIKEVEIQPKYYGNFYVDVETEATTTGMASISYYFTISKKGVILRTNTYHEPTRCNGIYLGKVVDNILELYYQGTEQYCTDENPNFKLKKEGDKFFIQGLGGEGTFNEWVEIKKEK